MVAVLAGLGAQAVVDSSKLTVLEGSFWASVSSKVALNLNIGALINNYEYYFGSYLIIMLFQMGSLEKRCFGDFRSLVRAVFAAWCFAFRRDQGVGIYYGGYTAPYDLSAAMLLVGFCIIATCWSENYGQRSETGSPGPREWKS